MVRLIIAAIGVFLIWVLFLSKFTKQTKLMIALAAIVLSVVAIWFESSLGTPRDDLIAANQVVDCGVSAELSYRTTYDLDLCIENQSATAGVTRLAFEVIAVSCQSQSECQEQQRVAREVAMDIAPQSRTQVQQSLNFDQIDPAASDLQWRLESKQVLAVPSSAE